MRATYSASVVGFSASALDSNISSGSTLSFDSKSVTPSLMTRPNFSQKPR